jgi:hypothetical protein
MLNQSFTADNFETIYDIENRKNNIKAYMGAKYSKILSLIKKFHDEITRIKRIKKIDRTENDNNRLTKYQNWKEILVAYKKEIQHTELENISKEINRKNFKFDLQSKGDDIFVIQNNKEVFFAIKQLQYNIRKTFKVKQSSRHLILSQIKLLLNDSSPKYVIRTDVSKFFESIPQKKLFRKIKDNTLLSAQSKKFILQIIEDYNDKKDTTKIDKNKGVPRGVGISSYLSELYMKDIDNQIRNLKDVIYYARYVDDIFIIISPCLPKKDINTYYEDIKRITEKEGLILHPEGEKCNLIDLTKKVTSNKHHSVTYLGYAVHIEQKPNNTTETTFGLSQNKKDKIESRVLKSIDDFNSKSKYDIKTARKNLMLCLRFLATNTKLSGAKSRVKTGIYYSNDLLDRCYEKDITCFDNKLKGNWLSNISPYDNLFKNQQDKQQYVNKLKTQILKRSNFHKGFAEKTYHIFSKNDLKTIKSILE